VAGDTKYNGYPQRASLIADLCGLWKAARRPVPTEWRTSILDGEGWDVRYRLADRLARHLSFEHLSRRELRDALVEAVRSYRAPAAATGLITGVNTDVPRLGSKSPNIFLPWPNRLMAFVNADRPVMGISHARPAGK